ncbi:MAG: oligosaccharide flippase family protein [Chloroflexi bacterium]|nr:oligosaccharide flippase family protein [Chloroflexota bacterium]MCC6897186.1 oligosaccharide flippase family protein [Anaerolineae bacterium]
MVTPDRLRAFFNRKFVRDTLILQVGKVGMTASTFLSALLVARLMGAADYGIWALAQSVLSIAQTFNLTGLNTSLSTQLPMAVGAKDEPEILNLLAVFVKVALFWGIGVTAVLLLVGPALTGLAYNGDTHIGLLAAFLSLTVLPDMLYGMMTTTLQSQRAMRRLVIVTNLNQLVLLACTLVALLISPSPESMVASRVVYSVTTCIMALWFYERYRNEYAVPYPPIRRVIGQVKRVNPRRYLGFGFLNAVDKNIAGLYTEIPLQIVGIYAGKTAAGYLELGFKALTIPATLASALFDNIQAVVPQAIGRRDFKQLWRNFMRVLVALGLGAVGFYALFVIFVPLIVPLIFSDQWIPAVPIVRALALYGIVLAVGGIFGPLYRGLGLMRPIIAIKVITLIAILLPGLLLLQQGASLNDVWDAANNTSINIGTHAQSGAVTGAWIVNLLLFISAFLTALVALPALRRKAHKS